MQLARTFQVMCFYVVLALLLLGSAAAAAQEGKTVISFGTWTSASGAFEAVIEEFEALHPDIEVEYRALEWGGETGYLEQVLTLSVAGLAPDVMEISYAILPQLVEAGGILLPIDPYLERDAHEVELSDFVPIALEAVSWQGRFYGLPFEMSLWWVNYNRDAFAEAGIADPAELYERGDWTWDAMIASAQRMTRRDGEGNVQQIGIVTFPRDAGTYPWLWAFGGDLLNGDGTRAKIADPESIEGIAHAHDLMYKSRVMAFPTWMATPNAEVDMDALLAQGAIGMVPWWNSLIGSFESLNPSWKYDQVALPPGPVNPVTVPTHIHTIAMMQQTETRDAAQREAAWKFIKFLEGEGYRHILQLAPNLAPVRLSNLAQWANSRIDQGIDGLRFVNDGMARTRLRPRHSKIGEIETMTQEELMAVWRDEAPVESVLERLAARINNILVNE